jgi:hypothetical protein
MDNFLSAKVKVAVPCEAYLPLHGFTTTDYFQQLLPPDVSNNTTGERITTGLQFLRKHAVTQLVEALRYKPERRGFDSR